MCFFGASVLRVLLEMHQPEIYSNKKLKNHGPTAGIFSSSWNHFQVPSKNLRSVSGLKKGLLPTTHMFFSMRLYQTPYGMGLVGSFPTKSELLGAERRMEILTKYFQINYYMNSFKPLFQGELMR